MEDPKTKEHKKSIINSVDISSKRREGRGILEFWTTPGPTAFLILSMLHINSKKYKKSAEYLGEILLLMQEPDGGVVDGDRAPDKVHTEPHMDAYCAFLMLYQMTNDVKWKNAADKAFLWFRKNVFHPRTSTIDQGVWGGVRNDIFATDAYTWTIAGPAGDKISLKELSGLTGNMLNKSLVKVSLDLPGKKNTTVVLTDFSDPRIDLVKKARDGLHPLGSVEWTGGAILVLQKNAVRFYKARDHKRAKLYKALAEFLFNQTMNCFYYVKEIDGAITFYATGQGVEVAPFGSIRSGLKDGWKTPFFFTLDDKGNTIIEGGSSVGIWPLLPYFGLNPFILNDDYKKDYDRIQISKNDRLKAKIFADNVTKDVTFKEVMFYKAPSAKTQIIEPAYFNKEMWKSLECGDALYKGKEYKESQECYEDAIKWANKILSNPLWVDLARKQNQMKEDEFGGIIFYPWGTTYEDNRYPTHQAILRYPLLNEIATAMWGMAAANYELGYNEKAKYWMQRVIEDVPLHQIASTQESLYVDRPATIKGYWNAIVTWEDNPGNKDSDLEMGKMFRQVLDEEKMTSAKPEVVSLPEEYLKGYYEKYGTETKKKSTKKRAKK